MLPQWGMGSRLMSNKLADQLLPPSVERNTRILFELIVVEGTLYPLLTRLKNAGLLTYIWRESTTGPPRKYFQLTEDGQSFLSGLKDSWENLVNAVNQTTKINNSK